MKVLLGYLVGMLLTFGFVLMSWNNLNTIEDMVNAGEIVTDLFDATLEIRRFEKNYFLYNQADDFQELLGYVQKARELVAQPELELFARQRDILALDALLGEYDALLATDPASMRRRELRAWEIRVRNRGKAIVGASEMISQDRKRLKRFRLQSTKEHLIVAVGLLFLIGISGGAFYYWKAVRPLSVIERHMVRIAEGQFSLIPTRFKDSEVLSLKAAFNRMLLELQARQRHLVQSEKLASLGTLVFGVAHELNNPLSNISTSTQILREEMEDGDPEHQRDLLDQIEQETDRARDVVVSLLDYSRSKEKRQFFLGRAVEETIRLMRTETPPKVSIRTEVPESLYLYADKQKIQQVVLNLIKNAVDAVGGDGEIVISASSDGVRVEMVVRDDGIGMDEETLSKIFDPFFSSKEGKAKGYGLGLFIVHNIIEEHGGTITADSTPGHGTAFTITLPLREEA